MIHMWLVGEIIESKKLTKQLPSVVFFMRNLHRHFLREKWIHYEECVDNIKVEKLWW